MKKDKSLPRISQTCTCNRVSFGEASGYAEIKLVDVEPRKKGHGIVLVTITAIYKCKSPVRLQRRYLEIAEWRYINILG